MGYESGKTYWIVPQNNTGVALSVYGNTQVSQNRNVIVWSKQDIADQLWRVDVSSGYARIKSTINDAYALNIWLGSSNYGNCDIHTWSDNPEDSKINFRTVDASQNLYLIQNYRNNADNDLYLTRCKRQVDRPKYGPESGVEADRENGWWQQYRRLHVADYFYSNYTVLFLWSYGHRYRCCKCWRCWRTYLRILFWQG